MRIVTFLGFCGMMPSSSATVLGNMVGKVSQGMCVCCGGCWSVGGVSVSDMRGQSDLRVMVLELDSSLGGCFIWSYVVQRNGLLVEWLVW